jgi:hypothetical protein
MRGCSGGWATEWTSGQADIQLNRLLTLFSPIPFHVLSSWGVPPAFPFSIPAPFSSRLPSLPPPLHEQMFKDRPTWTEINKGGNGGLCTNFRATMSFEQHNRFLSPQLPLSLPLSVSLCLSLSTPSLLLSTIPPVLSVLFVSIPSIFSTCKRQLTPCHTCVSSVPSAYGSTAIHSSTTLAATATRRASSMVTSPLWLSMPASCKPWLSRI